MSRLAASSVLGCAARSYSSSSLDSGSTCAVTAFISVIVGPGDPSYSETSVFGVIAVIYGAVGVALGALVALWLDRRSLKKSVTAQVEPESKEEDE